MLLYVLPVETIAAPDLEQMEALSIKQFDFKIQRLDPMPMPPKALDPRRHQYDATTILRAALETCPPDATRLLAVTEQDICIPMLTFVFGQAQVNGTVALLSLARLRQEYHGLTPCPELFQARVRKETLHELGHTFGLFHCHDADCAMALSINIAGIDAKQDSLCSDCTAQLDNRIREVRLEMGATKE